MQNQLLQNDSVTQTSNNKGLEMTTTNVSNDISSNAKINMQQLNSKYIAENVDEKRVGNEMDEEVRTSIVKLFAAYLNLCKLPIDKIEFEDKKSSGEYLHFVADDMSVSIDNVYYKTSEEKIYIEVFVWLDGIMQVSCYHEETGGMHDVCGGHKMQEVIDNPEVLIKDINYTYRTLINQIEDMEDDYNW